MKVGGWGMGINISSFLAAGWYYYLASTFEYLNNIYQKKLEKCCTLFTLYSLEISDPIKEQNTISEVARQSRTTMGDLADPATPL